jgi:hypothetical protein
MGNKIRPLWRFHENRSADTSVQTREALIADNLTEAVDHAVVGFLASSSRALQLYSCLYNI